MKVSALFELAPPVDSENLKKIRALDFISEFNTINGRVTTHFDSEDKYRAHRLSKGQSLFRTTFTGTIIFHLLIK